MPGEKDFYYDRTGVEWDEEEWKKQLLLREAKMVKLYDRKFKQVQNLEMMRE